MLRIFLFLATNLAVLAMAGVTMAVLTALGVIPPDAPYITLLIWCALFGFGGSLISLAMSKTIAKRSTRAKVIETPSNEIEQWLVRTVERQAKEAGIGMPEVAVFDSPDPNAFATGMFRNSALVAVSTGLLRLMSKEEAEAVLGHEVSHVANGDMVTLTLIQGVLNTFVLFIARIIAGQFERGSYLIYIGLQMAFGVLASIIVAWFSRRREFRADAGHLLVADIGATSIDVAVADASGRIMARHSETADVADGPETILGRVEVLLDNLVTDTQPVGELWGLGIGVPGPVEFRTGHPASPPIMPGWDGYPVREHFTERYGVPTWVDNDVNIMALGEWRAGAAKGQRDVIFVKVGTGIGSGIISNGLIHRGAQGSAGDIGHIRVLGETEEICRCGKVGCLEALAGGGAIGRDGQVLAQTGRSDRLAMAFTDRGRVSARDVGRAAAMGDAASLELLQRSGRLLGQTLAGLVNFFNPSLILIGGGVAGAGDPYLATVRQIIYERSAPLSTRDLVVQLSRLGHRAGVTGAASMVLDQLFSAEHLGRWIDKGQPAGLEIVAA